VQDFTLHLVLKKEIEIPPIETPIIFSESYQVNGWYCLSL